MRSVKTVPCRTQEWDFCYNPYSVGDSSLHALVFKLFFFVGYNFFEDLF